MFEITVWYTTLRGNLVFFTEEECAKINNLLCARGKTVYSTVFTSDMNFTCHQFVDRIKFISELENEVKHLDFKDKYRYQLAIDYLKQTNKTLFPDILEFV